jgi:HD-GYP domain-containing protein (c-di-GMP phosphodiesterase class II)
LNYTDVINFADELLTRKDPYNHHGKNASILSIQIAKRIGMSTEQITLLDCASRLHDVGKILLDDLLLNFPRPLTAAERERIKTHAYLGYDIVASLNYHPDICEAIKHHHEHYDGSGYHRTRGENIPLFSRIICLADVWDALTNDRVYRAAMPFERALAEMARNQSWFDPELYAVFMDVLREQHA